MAYSLPAKLLAITASAVLATSACSGRPAPGLELEEAAPETPLSTGEQSPTLAPDPGTACSLNPPPNAKCMPCPDGYQVRDGQVTCECCLSCATDPIVNMLCEQECPMGYLTIGDPCGCCETTFDLDYVTTGGEMGVHRQLTIADDKATLTTGYLPPGGACEFKLSGGVVEELLRLFRAVELVSVQPDFSPDNPYGCCDQLAHTLMFNYVDSQSQSVMSTRYLSEDFGETGDLPQAIQDLDAHLNAVISAAEAGPCQ